MTRKEAMIHTLVKENDELQTEIGRLRQVMEQTSCKDTISREAVLKEIPVLWNSNGDKDYCMESLRDFVAELPPADVIERTKVLGRVKQAREEIKAYYENATNETQKIAFNACLMVVDHLIKEVEG